MGERLTWQRGRDPEKPEPTTSTPATSGTTEKLDFLYNQQEIDQEQYLTGKKVDKAFNDYLAREKRNFDSSLDPHKNDNKTEFDIGRKVLEDPLLVLKQRENEKFQQLKANPQKMARLQKLMKAYLGQDEAPAADEDKSKRKRRVSDDKRSDRGDRNRSKPVSSSSRHRDSHRRDADRRRSKSRSRSPKQVPEGYGLINVAGKSGDKKRGDEKYESKFAAYKNVPHAYRRQKKQGFSNAMTPEEKARKIAEMTGNAEAHDEDRKKRVTHGRKVDAANDAANEGNKNDHSFYRNMKLQATEKTLEERVKARTSSNQKTAAALDRNWTKR